MLKFSMIFSYSWLMQLSSGIYLHVADSDSISKDSLEDIRRWHALATVLAFLRLKTVGQWPSFY